MGYTPKARAHVNWGEICDLILLLVSVIDKVQAYHWPHLSHLNMLVSFGIQHTYLVTASIADCFWHHSETGESNATVQACFRPDDCSLHCILSQITLTTIYVISSTNRCC